MALQYRPGTLVAHSGRLAVVIANDRDAETTTVRYLVEQDVSVPSERLSQLEAQTLLK